MAGGVFARKHLLSSVLGIIFHCVFYCLAGCRQLQDLELPWVEVDPCGDAQAAAEGASLGIFEYEELKQKKKPTLEIQLHGR